MALSVSDFWKLLQQSRLLSQEQCQRLSAGFSAVPGAATAPGKTLAEWLVRQNVLSKYQAVILLAGRAGPFFYGDYKIYDRIDGGRLSGMFRAVHVGTNHRVMLRFLAGPVTQSPQAWAEIQRILPTTNHAQVVRAFHAVDLGTYKFIVQEDLRGKSLAEVLEQQKRFPSDEACRIMRLAALGVAHLHAAGRVHGDLRPQNLWVEKEGNVKVMLDPELGTRTFHLAAVASEPDGLARADYAAPEFLQAGRPADPLTDVYALGCTLYQCMAGRVPFPDEDLHRKLQRHATEAIQPLDAAGVPQALTQLVAYCMAKNPGVRFPKAATVAEQLVPFLGGAPQKQKLAAPLASLQPFEQWVQQQPVGGVTHQPHAPAPHPHAAGMRPQSAPQVLVNSPAVSPVAGLQFPEPTPAFPAAGVAPTNAPVAPVGIAAPAAVASLSGVGKASSVTALIQKRARARRRNNLIFLAFSILTLAGAGYAVYRFANAPASGPQTATGDPAFAPPGASAPVAPPSTGQGGAAPPTATAELRSDPAVASAAPDDGQTLWASPTSGEPLDLKWVPPGAQVFLVLRPADLLAHPEGERVLKALGPEFEAARAAWETTHGAKWADVEQLTVGLYANQGQPPKTAYVVRMKADASRDALLNAWGQPTAVEGLADVYQKGEVGYHLPPDDLKTFVVGPLEPEMKDAATAGWKPPLLRREIGQLLQKSDAQRHLTVLFAPNFLFGEGQGLFSGDRARVMRPLEWFLGDGLKSGMVSAHLGDHFYFEMRMESDIQMDRFTLASRVRERMAEIPSRIESYIAQLNPHPYWRLVAFRFPAMIRFLHEHTRIGVDGNQAMLNSALPAPAAHNLLFGSEMVMASVPGAAVATTTGPAKAAGPQSVDQLLQSKISIGFAQESLEFAMQNIVTEAKAAYPEMPFEFRIKILGTDLEKDGITRNQQIREFDMKDQTVSDVLTAMVRKANPVTTVKTPDEVDQKLVWVVAPDPEKPTDSAVLITTRTAAGQKNYTLPELFRPK